jgi:hypothetical protein
VGKWTRDAWTVIAYCDCLLFPPVGTSKVAPNVSNIARNGFGRVLVGPLPDDQWLLSGVLHALETRASHYYRSTTASRRSDRDLCAIGKI